jgi:hypothetical protein
LAPELVLVLDRLEAVKLPALTDHREGGLLQVHLSARFDLRVLA